MVLVGTLDGMQHASRRFESDQLHQVFVVLVGTLDGMQHASRRFESDQLHHKFSMADIAQLVRALVCGTKCRRFESGYPPHKFSPPRQQGLKI